MNRQIEPALEIATELGAGESLLWSGRPRQGIIFRAADIFMIPFSLMWGGFAVFWEAMALSAVWNAKQGTDSKASLLFFPLWGIPFVVIGLYLIFGRFIVEKLQREKTVYGLTTQRVIILSNFFNRKTKSLDLRALPELSISHESNGRGTITFGPDMPFGRKGRIAAPSFDSIDDAKRIYDLVRQAQAKAQGMA